MEKEKVSNKKPKKNKPTYGILSNIWFVIRTAWNIKEKKVPLLCLAVSLLAVANSLVNLFVVPAILTQVENRTSMDMLAVTIVEFVLCMAMVSALSAYVNGNTMYGRYSVRNYLRDQVCIKSATTSYENLGTEEFEKLMHQAIGAMWGRGAIDKVWDNSTGLLTNSLGFIIYALMLTNLNPMLAVIILCTAIASYYANRRAQRYRHTSRDEKSRYLRQLNYLQRLVNWDWPAGKDIRIFGLRPWILELYEKALQIQENYNRRTSRAMLYARIFDLVFAFLRNGVAYAYLISMVLRGELAASEFILFFTTVSEFANWVMGILGGVNELFLSSIDISSMREFLHYPEPFRFEEGEPLRMEQMDYEICLEDVSYRYPEAKEYVLKHVNLTLHPGEKLAIVGMNGAGKTTLVKLLCGYLDPTEGRVLLNGQDIRVYNRRDYYKMFSAVFQNFSLLPGSIAMNIAQSEENIDVEKMKDCAAKAGLAEKITSLPQGYETKLYREVYDDAIMLSGGETQRLMLARALYKDAVFIVLDEPTAALDPIAESQMYEQYHQMTQQKTSVYISHRLASTRFCDRVLLIADGNICEEGTHEELLQLGGKYAEIYEIQSRYYREGETDEG